MMNAEGVNRSLDRLERGRRPAEPPLDCRFSHSIDDTSGHVY